MFYLWNNSHLSLLFTKNIINNNLTVQLYFARIKLTFQPLCVLITINIYLNHILNYNFILLYMYIVYLYIIHNIMAYYTNYNFFFQMVLFGSSSYREVKLFRPVSMYNGEWLLTGEGVYKQYYWRRKQTNHTQRILFLR